jgi:hypothetical protein
MPSLKEVTPVTKVPDDAHCIEEAGRDDGVEYDISYFDDPPSWGVWEFNDRLYQVPFFQGDDLYEFTDLDPLELTMDDGECISTWAMDGKQVAQLTVDWQAANDE